MPSGSPELPVQGDEVEILCGPVLFRSALPLRSGSAPAHVEDTGAVRGRLRELAVAGAGIICSPSDLTYRRALSRIGQARRQREWTMAAVAVARGAAEEAEDADRVSMTPVRVAGVLAPLEDAADPAAAPDPGTCLREHREHAGLLAEAGVDMLIVTGMGTVREARAATAAATESGLPIWTSTRLADGATLVSGESLEAWREAVEVAAPHGRLVEVGQAADVPAAL
ncbi:MAG: homocysteine S-methyltransferase family protein, partial [Chloroflexi bacterium]|nr:homocysteine S-methyltransferase family protein [Chloroflexota bacterium]